MFLNKMGEQIFTCFEEEQLHPITGPPIVIQIMTRALQYKEAIKSLQPHCPHWGTLVHKYLIVITAIKDLSLNTRPRASHVPGVFP
jgi:hypothetical protein